MTTDAESAERWVCPACGYEPASEAERQRHEKGIDDKHLACAHQDIDAIKACAEPLGRSRSVYAGMPWG